jgi:choline kinase
MNTPFLLVNGDTLFAPSTLAQLLSSERVFPITLAVDRKGIYDDDDMKISADGEQLNRVGKDLDINIVNGESIGIMAFSRAGATAFVQKVENLMSSTDGLARWYLSAVDELAMTGMVGICSIQGHDWCEVDDLSDFTHAEKEVRNWEKRAEKPGARSSTRTEAFQRQVA